jgi:hypothetical protein
MKKRLQTQNFIGQRKTITVRTISILFYYALRDTPVCIEKCIMALLYDGLFSCFEKQTL